MEEGRLAYRVRTAEAGDATRLRDAIGTTLAHPDNLGRRESYTGAASRGDIVLLERYDRASHDWHVAGFFECHVRIDDNLSIRDVGTSGEEPQNSVVRYLFDQAINAFRPVAAQIKIRRDAAAWLDIFRNIPGFYLEGEEYRRPHYWTIWRWERQRADEDQRRPAASQTPQPQRPQPPRPPTPGPSSPGRPRTASGPGTGGPRTAGSGGSGRPPGPRPGRPPRRQSRPAKPR
ncbi:MAG: hypothetical protein NVSMB2_04570 [Chloroflexota bacterium]